MWLLVVTILSLIILQCSCTTDTALSKFQASSCSELFQSADWIDRGHIESMLPPIEFWDFFVNRTLAKNDIMLVDVDMYSWELLLNQVIALRRSGSKLADNVYGIAYDNSTCANLASNGIQCFFSQTWHQKLTDKYREQTGHNPYEIHVIMLGRMMTTTIALCEGHNVFLSDTDVVFYRDPIQYAFHEANIMITATKIHPHNTGWGGNFFADRPEEVYTLNNGVVFFRSNAVTKSFSLTLVADSINSLKGRNDVQQGFLQKVFNGMMVHNKLVMHSSSIKSDPVTYKLNTSHFSNDVGECYDCYYGHFPWYSNVVHPVVLPNQHRAVLKIGVYPMKRYTSYCQAPTGLKDMLFAAASALNNNDTSNWNWGDLGNHTSRVLFTHANCVDIFAGGEDRFKKKADWLRSMGSWFL